jgi:RNA polymerase sigma-70 factor (ECF subfamily)
LDSTSATLLERLRQPDCHEAWARFVQLYTPLLYYWARQVGVPRAEIDDLVQDVFVTLLQKLPQLTYDRQRTFRGWLRTVTLNKWNERRRRQTIKAVPLDGEQVADVALPDPARQFWEKEYQKLLLRRAVQLMRTDFPDSWEACYQVLIEGKNVAEVAAARGLTANALHQAKFRLLHRLRRELAGLLE